MSQEWLPIESAPKNENVIIYGYQINGQAAPSGPYKYYLITVGRTYDGYSWQDILKYGEYGEYGRGIEHPLFWMPMPKPPEKPTIESILNMCCGESAAKWLLEEFSKNGISIIETPKP